MKIYSLIENTQFKQIYLAEHGLSLYIETAKHKILFDFGQSDAFVKNADLLGIDLSQVDIAILSHGHYDHGGGISHFLKINNHANVYLNKHAFNKYYNGTKKYIGLDYQLKDNNRLIFTGDYLKIDDELEICTCNHNNQKYPLDSAGLTIKQNDLFTLDTFIHEQYLIINDNNKKVVIGGCLHKGVLNVMDWLKPDILIGGFHLKKQEIVDGYNATLEQIGKILSKYDTVYYTCHCTGIKQYEYLKRILNHQLYYLASGQKITI